MAELLNIFPKIYAQSPGPDAISQPTFGSINVTGGNTQTSSILLKSTSTATNVGQRFKVRVEIKTNTVTVNEYKVVIDFDPTKLQVVDQDNTVVGNQIKNLDAIFLAQNPQTDNIVSSTGRITFIGKTSDGNPLSINREVLEIEFQAQAVGTSPIRIITGASGSQLIRQNGSGVSYTGNEVNIQVAAATTGNNGTTPPSITTPPPSTGGGIPNPPVTTLPDTALEAGVSDLAIAGLGIILIVLGTKLSLNKNKTSKNSHS